MNMIEKVARAMSVSEKDFDNDPGGYLLMARAAIEAMREPTAHMLDAPYHADIDFGPGGTGEIEAGPANVWQAMIEAALKEQ